MTAPTNSSTADDISAGPGRMERLFLQHPLLFVLALAAFSAFTFQGSRGLYESTEGRYAECARQSLAAGSLDEPTLNGHHHWTKPPLTYVIIAAGLTVFGENAWGARIGLAVAFVLTVIIVFLLGALVWDRRSGAWCALVYASSPFPLGAANALSTDTFLALWMAAAGLFFWYSARKGGVLGILLMWAALGLGFMTKGPVALLALIPIVITSVHLRRRGRGLPVWHHVAGLFVFGAVGLPWFVMKMIEHPELREYWMLHETIGRNLYGEFNRNSQFYKPFEVYGPVLLFGSFPWTLPILFRRRSIPWPRGMWRRITQWPHPAEWLYVVSGVLGPLLIFCLSTSRLTLYVLPLSVPISLALGRGLDHLVVHGAVGRRTLLRIALATSLILVTAKGVAARTDSSRNMQRLAARLSPTLQEFPNHDLLVLASTELYGLQFYTGEQMRAAKLDEAQQVIKESRSTGRAQLVLVKNSLLEKLEPHMDARVYEVRQVSSRWALIIFAAPGAKNGGA